MALLDSPAERGRYGALAAFLALTMTVAALGSWSTVPEIPHWYAGLVKPGFNPPSWVFGPVWTALYAAMAVAAWRVWRLAGMARPLALFFVQLALNCAWSFLFFRAHELGLALADSVAMLVMIVWTGLAFYRRDRIAGALFVPYAAWVSFATVLNAAVWQLN